MRIFLDANILFSAAKAAGAIGRLIDWLIDSGHECCVNRYVVEEARRNLALKAPQHYGKTVRGVTIHSPRSIAEALV